MSNLHKDLLASSIPPVYLPDDAEERAVLADATDPSDAARQFPGYSLAWATLADRAYAAGDPVTSYAYARTGYHRGLDQLRGAGWRGQGPVPWEHEPNQGFLRAMFALGRAAAAIGEDDEAQRCSSFLRETSPAAAAALEH